MLVFHLKHVWMDITDLIAFICAPILTLVDGVWRGHVSVQKKTVTQKPDVEVVRNICSIWLFSFLSLTVVFITIIIFLFKKKLANMRGHNTRAIFLPKTSILKKKLICGWLIKVFTLQAKRVYPELTQTVPRAWLEIVDWNG